MTIPIRNLYYLFCYAWARFPQGDATEVGVDACPDVPNLFARVLINGMNRLVRKGLDRGYRAFEEEVRSPRGRMLLDRIIKEQTLLRGAVACRIDELSHDVPHNRILKATALALARVDRLEPDYAHELKHVVRRLQAVSDIRLSAEAFRNVQLSRHTRDYLPLLKLCEMVFRSLMPDENGQGSRFADILDDEVTMSAVFEDFLRNFYAYEQRAFRVGREVMSWSAESLTPGSLAHLPRMETDITLRSSDRIVVIDAKYYKEALIERHDVRKVHSSHLYQLHAYLRHTALNSPSVRVDGALIYPAAGDPISLGFRLFGHDVRVVAVDLTQSWPAIHRDLLGIVFGSERAPERLDMADRTWAVASENVIRI